MQREKLGYMQCGPKEGRGQPHGKLSWQVPLESSPRMRRHPLSIPTWTTSGGRGGEGRMPQKGRGFGLAICFPPRCFLKRVGRWDLTVGIISCTGGINSLVPKGMWVALESTYFSKFWEPSLQDSSGGLCPGGPLLEESEWDER